MTILRKEGYMGFIVGLSGTSENEPEFMEAGTNAVLFKPLETSSLEAVLDKLGVKVQRKLDT